MDDGGTPALGVGFEIDAEGAFGNLIRLDGRIDETVANAVAEFDRVKRATAGMVDLGGATAAIKAFGSAATREAQNLTREKNNTAKAGEALIRQLDREAVSLGKTRDQLRAAKIETIALAAAQQKNTDLADRLLASARNRQAAAQAAAEAEAAAANEAAAAAAREEQAVREAANAYRMFEAVARQKMAAWREAQDAQAAAARATAAAEAELVREASQLRAALDPMFAAQQRFDAELERAERLFAAGAISAREYALAQDAARNALARHAQTVAGAVPSQAALAEQERRAAAAARDQALAEQQLVTQTNQLRAALDPMFAAQQRFDAELSRAETLLQRGAITQREYAQAIQLARNNLSAHAQAVAGAGSATGNLTEAQRRAMAAIGQNRMAMQGLSYQTQDTFTQLSMGANVFSVVAIQGSQLAGQFSMIEGRAGDVARFFMGPWGLAITAALFVTGALTKGLFENASALDKAVDRLKKDAVETEINRQAKELFIRTQEGVRKSLIDATEANEKWIDSQRTAAKQAAITARANELAMQAALSDNERRLAAAQQRLKGLSGPGASDARLAPARDSVAAEVAYLTKMIADQRQALDQLSIKTRQTYADLAEEAAKIANDPIESIKRLYEGENGLINQAKQRLINEKATSGEMGRQLGLLYRQEQAAIEAAQKQQALKRSAANDNRQTGRDISLTDAEQIVRSIGGVITSAARSFDQQRVLYERYLAGKGPLAAKPGTSDHEVGNALDIAKTPGMSLAKLREAFRAQGVAIKQLLDEGTHFHIAWKKGADGAAAASKALADTQAELIQKFDPAAAALLEYRKALAAIAAAKLDPATATRYADAAKDAFIAARAAAFSLPSMEEIRPAAADETAAATAAAEFQANVIQPLKDQLALYGLVGAARDRAALGLEKEAFLAANAAQGPVVALARWQEYYAAKTALIDKDDAAERQAAEIRNLADQFDFLLDAVDRAADGFARSFGRAGEGVADLLRAYTDYASKRQRIDEKLRNHEITQAQAARQTGAVQVDAYGNALSAAKTFFDEKSRIYKALATAEQVYRAVQLAMSIASMFQDTAETVSHVANAGARATANAAEGVSAQAKLPFPANIAAMAATAAAVVAFGIAMLGGGGGRSTSSPRSSEDIQKATGIGTVLGSPNDKSASIARSIDLVAKNTDGVLDYNSQMLNSLRSIDASIGAMAATVAKQINVSGSLYDTSKLGIGSSGSAGFLGLFSSSTTRTLYDAGITLAASTVGDIVAHGIAGQTYQIVQQVKKSSGFLGIGGGTKTTYQTTTGGLPSDISASIQSVIAALQSGIVTAAGAIGIDGAKAMLDKFTVSIGQLSFNGLDAQGIEDQLNAVFSSVGDQMVSAVLPGIAKFQKVGEGLFETLERVASTVVVVDGVMQKLGHTSTTLGIDVDMAIAGLFDSVGDFKSAADAYFETYYSTAEQTAAKASQIGKVFGSLGLAMPSTLAAFRALVDAQDLTTAAGQATYATLLQLAPAFADLQAALSGAKSAADILSERQDLERQLLELQGKTDEIRKLDLAKLDESNRALQLQIWALQDAQEAARAAEELRQAWKSVGESIMEEVKRIRGLNDATGTGGFAALMGQFNAATAAARGGDMDAAKSLPQLSQALLSAAAGAATSRQELARIQAQIAASLEATYGLINKVDGTASTLTDAALVSASAGAAQASASSTNDNDQADLRSLVDDLRQEIASMRSDNNAGHAATAANTAAMKKTLEKVTSQSGGDAISVEIAA